MSNIECAIKILKERGDIKCYAYGYDTMPMLYELKSDSTKIASKLFKELQEDDNYLVCTTTHPCRSLQFTKKDNFEQWIDEKCNGKEKIETHWKRSHLDYVLEKHVKDKYEMEMNRHVEFMKITNLAEKAKREAQEKEKEQEAIDLLEQIL